MGNNLSPDMRIEPTRTSPVPLDQLTRQPDHRTLSDGCIHYMHVPTGIVYSWNYREHEWERKSAAYQVNVKRVVFS